MFRKQSDNFTLFFKKNLLGYNIKELFSHEPETAELLAFFSKNPVNLWVSPLSELNQYLLDRLIVKRDVMISFQKYHAQREVTLCEDEIAVGVAVEFGFRGNRQAVLEHLEDLIAFRQSTPYSDDDREELAEQAGRYSSHLRAEKQNPYKVRRLALFETAIKCSARSIGSEQLIAGLHGLSIRMEELRLANLNDRHAKKECVCYRG